KMRFLYILFVLNMSLSLGYSQSIDLIVNGTSNYQIVLPEIPDVVEVQAAKVLQDYIHRIGGVSLPLADHSNYNGQYGIWVGKASRFQHGNFSELNLTRDGYLIRTVGDDLIIARS